MAEAGVIEGRVNGDQQPRVKTFCVWRADGGLRGASGAGGMDGRVGVGSGRCDARGEWTRPPGRTEGSDIEDLGVLEYPGARMGIRKTKRCGRGFIRGR